MTEIQYFTIYETTNNINGKMYRGVHKTCNAMDRYLGSGTILKEAISKYGREFFSKQIIFCAFSEEDAYIVEGTLVDKEWCDRRDTYNICIGGSGSVGSLNKGKKCSKEHIAKMVKWRTGRPLSDETKSKISRSHKGLKQTEEHTRNHAESIRGRKASEDTKMRQSVGGLGFRWITDGVCNSKTKDLDNLPQGWRVGKTISRTRHTKGWSYRNY